MMKHARWLQAYINVLQDQFVLVPARMAQLVRALNLKTRGCGFDPRAG